MSYNRYNRYNAQDIGNIILAVVICFIFLATFWFYADAAANCNGILIRDAAGFPRCIENPTVVVPVGR